MWFIPNTLMVSGSNFMFFDLFSLGIFHNKHHCDIVLSIMNTILSRHSITAMKEMLLLSQINNWLWHHNKVWCHWGSLLDTLVATRQEYQQWSTLWLYFIKSPINKNKLTCYYCHHNKGIIINLYNKKITLLSKLECLILHHC